MNIRDAPLLEAMREHIPYHTAIAYRTRTTNFKEHTSIALSMYAREAREIFKEYGVLVGHKSSEIAPPIQPFRKSDYVRGLIDSDGSIGFTSNGSPFVSLILSSDAMALFFQETIFEVCGVRRDTKRNSRDDVYNIMVTNVAAVKLARWLYPEDVTLALPRKLVAARAVSEWTVPIERAGRRTCDTSSQWKQPSSIAPGDHTL